MTKIYYISDIHLEFGAMELPSPDTDDNILLLAGDIIPAKYLDSSEADTFFGVQCAKYKKVFFILGNHEHYGYIYDETAKAFNDYFKEKRFDITLCQSDYIELNDEWSMLADTLWTDFNKDDWFAKNTAKQCMNDFRIVNKMVNGTQWSSPMYRRLVPEDVLVDHRATLASFLEDLEQNPDKKFVVMTHHLPSEQCVNAMFTGDSLNPAFFSELAPFIIDHPNIKFWVHGHTHCSVNVKIGECQVLCNPRGYIGHGANKEFDPTLSFEI